jgi:hypothetical protein
MEKNISYTMAIRNDTSCTLLLTVAIVYLNPFEGQLETAKKQLVALQMQEQLASQHLLNIQQQIQQVHVVVQAMEMLVAQQGAPQVRAMSLADLCRAALNAHQGEFITAHQVRCYIQQLGVTLQYNNVMAVLHNTLKRVGQSRPHNLAGTVYARK